jgi:hypothetical protein
VGSPLRSLREAVCAAGCNWRVEISISAGRFTAIGVHISFGGCTIWTITSEGALESETAAEVGRRAAHGDRLGYAVVADRTLGRVGIAGRSGGEAGVLNAIGFGFGGGVNNELRVDYHAAVFGGFWGNAPRGECWTEDGDEGWCNVGAESRAHFERAGIGHPIACTRSQNAI